MSDRVQENLSDPDTPFKLQTFTQRAGTSHVALAVLTHAKRCGRQAVRLREQRSALSFYFCCTFTLQEEKKPLTTKCDCGGETSQRYYHISVTREHGILQSAVRVSSVFVWRGRSLDGSHQLSWSSRAPSGASAAGFRVANRPVTDTHQMCLLTFVSRSHSTRRKVTYHEIGTAAESVPHASSVITSSVSDNLALCMAPCGASATGVRLCL